MSNAPYQEEEVKQILQALFLEKKKTKEQEERLKQLQAELEHPPKTEDAENVQRLENLLAFFKAKYEQAAQALTERLAPSPSVSTDEFEALQSQLQDLRTRLQDQLSRNQQLEDKNTTHEEELTRQKAKLEKLTELMRDKERQDRESHQFEQSYRKAKQQAQQLEEQVKQDSEKYDLLTMQYERTQTELGDVRQHNEQLERVIQFLRERSEESNLELNQFRDDYQASLDEIENLRKASQKTQQEKEEGNHQAAVERRLYEETVEELHALQGQLAVLRDISVAATSRDSETNERYRNQEQELQQTLQEVRNLHESIAETQQQLSSEREQNHYLRTQEENHKQELNTQRDLLATLQAEKDHLIGQLQHLIQIVEEQKGQLGEFQEAIRQANEREAAIKTESALLQTEKEQLLQEVHQANQTNAQLLQQIGQLEEAVQGAQQREAQAHQAIESIRQELSASHETAIASFVEERDRLSERLKVIEVLEAELQALQIQLAASQATNQELLNGQERSQTVLSELEAVHQRDAELMKLKDDTIDTVQGQLATALAEKEHLRENLDGALQEAQESDSRLKIAQQHLARKVKELNEQLEHMDGLKAQLAEAQSQLNQIRLQHGEVKIALESQSIQDKRLQEQLQENARAAEVAISRWEEKYFKVYEKWQESEGRIRDLKRLEEKYNQMQAWLANLGNLIGTPVGINPSPAAYASTAPTFEEAPLPTEPPEITTTASVPEPDAMPPQPEPERHFRNLFNMPRQDLFD